MIQVVLSLNIDCQGNDIIQVYIMRSSWIYWDINNQLLSYTKWLVGLKLWQGNYTLGTSLDAQRIPIFVLN